MVIFTVFLLYSWSTKSGWSRRSKSIRRKQTKQRQSSQSVPTEWIPTVSPPLPRKPLFRCKHETPSHMTSRTFFSGCNLDRRRQVRPETRRVEEVVSRKTTTKKMRRTNSRRKMRKKMRRKMRRRRRTTRMVSPCSICCDVSKWKLCHTIIFFALTLL